MLTFGGCHSHFNAPIPCKIEWSGRDSKPRLPISGGGALPIELPNLLHLLCMVLMLFSCTVDFDIVRTSQHPPSMQSRLSFNGFCRGPLFGGRHSHFNAPIPCKILTYFLILSSVHYQFYQVNHLWLEQNSQPVSQYLYQ